MHTNPSEDTAESPPQPGRAGQQAMSMGVGRGGDADDDEDDEDEDEEELQDEGEEDVPSEMDMEDDEEDDAAGLPPLGTGSDSNSLLIKAVPTLEKLYGLREIGRDALCWQLSSAKPGNGVDQIRDGSLESYWQSDGNSQPHWIQVHFGRRVTISHVCLYLDFGLDESYTPRRVQVEVGMTNQDLISAIYPPNTQIEFHEPSGWCIIPISSPPDPLDDCEGNPYGSFVGGASNACTRGAGVGIRAHLIRISILSMHQNGRDTHVRQVQLYSPRMHNSTVMGHVGGASRPLASITNHQASSSSFGPGSPVMSGDSPYGDGEDDDDLDESGANHRPNAASSRSSRSSSLPTHHDWDDIGITSMNHFSSIR